MFKKLICAALSAVMVMSMGISTFADSATAGDDFVTPEIEAQYKAQTEQRIAEGAQMRENGVPEPRMSIRVDLLRQTDSRWSDLKFPCGHTTYGESGCAITSYAMAFRYYGRTSETPVTLAKAYNTTYGDPCWQSAANMAALRGRKLSAANGSYPSMTTTENAIIAGLRNHQPTVVQIERKNDSSRRHFVLAVGYKLQNGKYTILINDPDTRMNQTTLGGYSAWKVRGFATIA